MIVIVSSSGIGAILVCYVCLSYLHCCWSCQRLRVIMNGLVVVGAVVVVVSVIVIGTRIVSVFAFGFCYRYC